MAGGGELIGELVGETIAGSLRDGDVAKGIRRAAHFYKYFSLAKTGFEFGFHVAGQNYPGAVLVLARHIATDAVGDKAATFIVTQGGFAARIQLDTTGANKHRDVMGAMLGGHNAETELAIFNHEPFWDVQHADEIAAKAMLAVETATSMTKSASAYAKRIKLPRIYHKPSVLSAPAHYYGTWVDDERQGWGKLTFPDQGAYAGVFDAGEPTGFGRRTFADGSYYLGEIRPGETALSTSAKALSMSVSADSKRVFIGEHAFPLVLFDTGRMERHTQQIVPNGFGVEISADACTRGYWNRNTRKHTFELKEAFYEKLAAEAKTMFEESQYRSYMLVEAAKKGIEIAELRYRAALKDARWRSVLKGVAGEGVYAFAFDSL